MAGLCAPLPTLRCRPHRRPRTARGRCGSLLLHRIGLAPTTRCRSPGALRKILDTTPVPGVAAVIDDVVEGFENSVRQPVLPHELPDIFLAVEFGCAWRELQERDVVWNLEGLGAMPPGLIEEENSVSAWSDFGCDLIEVKLHSFGVAGRQHEGGAGSAFGADRTEQIGRLGPLIMGSTGA